MAATKKKKPRHSGALPVGDLVKLGHEQLERGQSEAAVGTLQRAEAEVRRVASPGGSKGATLPPHLAAAQPLIASLLARALFERALASSDPAKRIADLDEAVKRAPSELRYRLAAGACRLALGRAEQALEQFRKAREASPGDRLAERAFMLGLLATGQTREVNEWLKQAPADVGATPASPRRRLAAIRKLAVGNDGRPPGQAPVPAAGEQPSAVVPPIAEAGGDGALEGPLLRGLAALERGEMERARQSLGALPPLDRNPSRAEAPVLATQLFYSGALRCHPESFRDALTDLREAERLARAHALALPWRDRLAPYFHRIAEGAIEAGDLPLASECWQRILELHPEDKAAAANVRAARRAQANQAWRAGQPEQAVTLWREVFKTNPADERLLQNLAIGCERAGRPAEAIDFWRTLAQRWRQHSKSHAADAALKERLLRLEEHLVRLMIEADRPEQEILYELESALKIEPANHALRRRYADLLIEIGRPERAVKQLEMIERSQGTSADLLVAKGFAFDVQEKDAAARRCFERALELDPNHTVARQAYLMLLGREAMEAERYGDPQRALEICQEQLARDPDYAPALAHLASLQFRSRQDEEAKRTIARLVEADPRSAPRRVMAGSIYLAHGRVRPADAEFKQAFALDPSDQCAFNIGRSYLEFGKTKKALKQFAQAAELGSFPTLLLIASALLDAKHFAEAGQYIDKAMQEDPRHPEPHLAKASLFSDMGNLAESRREVTEAERLASGRPEFAELLDDIRMFKRDLRERMELEEMLEATGKVPPGLAGLPPDLLRLLGKMARPK